MGKIVEIQDGATYHISKQHELKTKRQDYFKMVVATQYLAEKRTSDKQLQLFLATSFNGFSVWGVSHKCAWVPAVHFQLSLNQLLCF